MYSLAFGDLRFPLVNKVWIYPVLEHDAIF